MLKELTKSARTDMKPRDKQTEIIAITSGKGGVGKSSLSINMALMIKQLRKKVLLMDADIHLGNVDLMLGLRSTHTVDEVLEDGVHLEDIIVSGPGELDVLPASSANARLLDMEDVFLRKLAQEYRRIENRYDYVLVDTGAGVANSVLGFLLGADKIMIVVTSDPASVADAYAVIKLIKNVNVDIPVLMTPNMMPSHEAGEELYKKMRLMVNKFLKSDIDYAGTVLKHELIARSVKTQKPVVLHQPNASASNNIRMISKKIMQTPRRKDQDKKNIFDRFIVNKKVPLEWD
ncbi:MAG TPA: MinD/ParA family protein [Caldithrix abyssi]|uniref:MinD/ParA family protein n=1 Tax=Caldithrix abyssi TaxID=187145 RepID=A0A7V5RNS4_CALAY|nr:MinD/ParA family protein [Caldithrix abyssi]